jgi:hypothetical protein
MTFNTNGLQIRITLDKMAQLPIFGFCRKSASAIRVFIMLPDPAVQIILSSTYVKPIQMLAMNDITSNHTG